jgi:thioredoxin reductase (NADPH)
LLLTDKKGGTEEVTAKYILVACGGRPNLGGYPGAEECCISSDDIFWKTSPPGKTLVIGASYIALECAGFIAGFGFDTTVMVRSILLRGFDETCAVRIGEYMESKGVKFAREMVPSKFEKTADGKVKVFVKDAEYGIFDTVFVAIGRNGCANQLNLDAVGIPVTSSGKIEVGEDESTKVPSIFAIGDVCEGKPELTPVAIQAGKYLVNRIFRGSKKLMDYTDIATTVFTPLEYGTIGFSEEEAIKKFGKDNLTIYHALNQPLEWQLNDHRKDDYGYFKIICDKTKGEKVIGAHVLGPNAGEVIQCLGVAFKAGFSKEHLDDCVGIHPTFAETMTGMTQVKVEGKDIEKPGGC